MKQRKRSSQNGTMTVGLLILIIGSVLLLQRLGIFFPSWLFSWPMLIIAIGSIVLVKHQFRSGFGFFMVLFGVFFLLQREFHIPVTIASYLFPIGLILLGLYLMVFRKRNPYDQWTGWGSSPQSKGRDPFYTGNPEDKGRQGLHNPTESGFFSNDSGDVVDSQAIFCGVQKRVLSKNFYGGKISTFFGGTEIDLSQADIREGAILDVDVAFGGIKLVVPPHWDLKIEVTNIFAGIEDKRMYAQTVPDPTKVMVIKGTVIFGGLEIKSF